MATYYRELKIWQRAMELADAAYDLTQSFPSDERFGLTSQIRRSAVSVASNIAEGHARNSTKEYIQFLAITKGSLAELETQMLIAQRRGYAALEKVEVALHLSDEINRMANAIVKTLKEKMAA